MRPYRAAVEGVVASVLLHYRMAACPCSFDGPHCLQSSDFYYLLLSTRVLTGWAQAAADTQSCVARGDGRGHFEGSRQARVCFLGTVKLSTMRSRVSFHGLKWQLPHRRVLLVVAKDVI